MEANKHECFINWNKASTSMEADAILEGFSKSVEMHGLKYNCLIGNLYMYNKLGGRSQLSMTHLYIRARHLLISRKKIEGDNFT